MNKLHKIDSFFILFHPLLNVIFQPKNQNHYYRMQSAFDSQFMSPQNGLYCLIIWKYQKSSQKAETSQNVMVLLLISSRKWVLVERHFPALFEKLQKAFLSY